MTAPVILPNLLSLTAEALPAAEAICEAARMRLRDMVSADGRVQNALIEEHQTAAHGFAWLATYVQSLQQMQIWAEALQAQQKFGETEQLIHQIAFGEYLCQLTGGIPMNQTEVIRLRLGPLRRGGRSAYNGRCSPAGKCRQYAGRAFAACNLDAGI